MKTNSTEKYCTSNRDCINVNMMYGMNSCLLMLYNTVIFGIYSFYFVIAYKRTYTHTHAHASTQSAAAQPTHLYFLHSASNSYIPIIHSRSLLLCRLFKSKSERTRANIQCVYVENGCGGDCVVNDDDKPNETLLNQVPGSFTSIVISTPCI